MNFKYSRNSITPPTHLDRFKRHIGVRQTQLEWYHRDHDALFLRRYLRYWSRPRWSLTPRRATRRASPATRRQAPSWSTPISQISSKKQGVMVAMIPFKLSLPDADMPLEPIQVSGRRDGVPGVFEIHGGERRLRPLSHHRRADHCEDTRDHDTARDHAHDARPHPRDRQLAHGRTQAGGLQEKPGDESRRLRARRGALPREYLSAAQSARHGDPRDQDRDTAVGGARPAARAHQACDAKTRLGVVRGRHGLRQIDLAGVAYRLSQPELRGTYHHDRRPHRVHAPSQEVHRQSARGGHRYGEL